VLSANAIQGRHRSAGKGAARYVPHLEVVCDYPKGVDYEVVLEREGECVGRDEEDSALEECGQGIGRRSRDQAIRCGREGASLSVGGWDEQDERGGQDEQGG
jgi:hypothetical protein